MPVSRNTLSDDDVRVYLSYDTTWQWIGASMEMHWSTIQRINHKICASIINIFWGKGVDMRSGGRWRWSWGWGWGRLDAVRLKGWFTGRGCEFLICNVHGLFWEIQYFFFSIMLSSFPFSVLNAFPPLFLEFWMYVFPWTCMKHALWYVSYPTFDLEALYTLLLNVD